jgi:starch synthase
LFNDAKIVYSLYDEDLTAPLDGNFYKKLTDEGFNGKEVEGLKDSPSYANLSKLAIDKSDAVVMGSDNLNPELQSYIKDQKKNVLEYSEGEDYVDAYDAFYESILAK